MTILEGDIFEFAETGEYDLIIQGNNCFNKQGAGIAIEFNNRFSTLSFPMELPQHPFNDNLLTKYNKLGCIDYQYDIKHDLFVINCYTQYHPGKDARLWALASCLRKINYVFSGLKLLTPAICCGIGGLEVELVQNAMEYTLPDVDVYWVNYKQK